MSYWSCAQTHPRQEKLALRNLRRQAFTAFYPFFLVEHVMRGQRRRIVQPVFPGYVFVELEDATSWSPINSTMGVKRLLTGLASAASEDDDYRRPARVPFVAQLRRLRIRRPVDYDDQPLDGLTLDDQPIAPGTVVTIRRGAWAGRRALVEMSTAERVHALVECFAGRSLSVTFGLADVETAEFPEPLRLTG